MIDAAKQLIHAVGVARIAREQMEADFRQAALLEVAAGVVVPPRLSVRATAGERDLYRLVQAINSLTLGDV